MDMKRRFAPLGNMGCRQWWGEAKTLRNRDLGVWHGRWLMGVNGPKLGRFELAFEKWCSDYGHSCLRTVDLFWAFEYHLTGFPSRVDERVIRANWRKERQERREAPERIKQGRIFHFTRDLKKLSRAELKLYLDDWYPDPGPWSAYLAERRSYFLDEQARYRRVISFWQRNANLRKMFLGCASHSNRRPESHPDYLVLFRNNNRLECSFVEVKSPRESMRASQLRFFPELVKKAGQRVMLVRLTEGGENVRFFEFNRNGDLLPHSR